MLPQRPRRRPGPRAARASPRRRRSPAGGARVMAWDDAAPRARGGGGGGHSARAISPPPISTACARWCCRRASRTPSRAAPGRRPRPRRRHRDHRRHRAPGAQLPRRALCRHHRHQRQIDHHGADRPYPRRRRPPRRVGGNIGVPALLLDALGADGIYVLEMSSYQLELDAEASPSTSPCCSTSRPTISTAMAAWTAISPPRSASSRARPSGPMRGRRHRRRDLPRASRAASPPTGRAWCRSPRAPRAALRRGRPCVTSPTAC